MKKKIVVLLTVCSLSIALSACGNASNTTGENVAEATVTEESSVEEKETEAPTPEPTPTAIPTPTAEPIPTPEPTPEPTPTTEAVKEEAQAQEAKAPEQTEAAPAQAQEIPVQAQETPAQPAAANDVDAICNYAASLGYNVHRYIGRFGDIVFQCSYSEHSAGKIFTSYEAASADDSTDFDWRSVLVTFGTTDFVTVTKESVSISNYYDYNNPIVTVVAPRDYTGLENAYKLLADSKGL